MNKTRRGTVLAVGAHPDDIELGCAATLVRFIESGYEVFFLVVTDGGRGGDPVVRKVEQQRSADVLGVSHVFWGNFADTSVPFSEGVIDRIGAVVRTLDPEFVFVHCGDDSHRDHRHVSAYTIAATRQVPNVFLYEGPSTTGFDPAVFVHLDDELETKTRSLHCHETQLWRHSWSPRSLADLSEVKAAFRGSQCRALYAEAFIPQRMAFEPWQMSVARHQKPESVSATPPLQVAVASPSADARAGLAAFNASALCHVDAQWGTDSSFDCPPIAACARRSASE